ncbi:PREDICTED: MARVEL domain-containing protein 3 [Condylura cristata]|uniref:MARVEL domain-containing protein 3 n=1 Tax=Condylura cristata TaxID=143302 RepID=UPI0003344235|nr:PREDICTED: MARVEL domain-containing protein 3 [Condylura cristata]
MEDTSGTRESRTRSRERDPDRHPRRDRNRHPERPRDSHAERPRDRPAERRRERNGGGRRDGDRNRGRDRDPRQDLHQLGDYHADEPRAWGKSRQSQAREAPRRPTWDAAPPPWPREAGEPTPSRKEGFGRRAPPSELTLGRYLPQDAWPGEEVEYYQSEAEGLLECHKCRYLCTGRGVVQIVEVILNGMVLICIVASYFVLAGFSASFTHGGGFGNNYYSPFEGTELEQVRQLDQKYAVLRAPLIYGGVAVSLGLGVLTMGVLLQGSKNPSRLPSKWLFLEVAFSLLAAAGYCIGIGFYLHGALKINATDTCKTRERLYARKGLTWMNCQLAGTDGAAATFACLLVIMYSASVVLALRRYREQKHYKDSQEQQHSCTGAPEYLWSGIL